MSELKIEIVGPECRAAAVADIIFVHGLGGDGQTTWRIDGDASTYWPLWVYQDLTTLNVWSLTYPAATLRWGKAGDGIILPDRAKTILDLLCSSGIGSRPIIFITHSLGGLLVKQLLRSAWELQVAHWQELAGNIRGAVFLGTPHNGSGLAAFAKALSIFSGVTTQIVHNDPHLRELNEWFQQNAHARQIGIKTYFETQLTNGFTVVDASSANPGVEGCVPIAFDGNHLQLCKPTSRLSPLYTGCCHFIESSLKPRNNEVASDIQDSDEAMLADQYAFFTIGVDGDRLDLAQKLTLGARQSEIPRALRFKEAFAKSFARNQLQTTSTRHYLKVLAEIESRFNGHVFPEIASGASRSVVADLIRSKVTDPVLEKYASGNLVDAVVVDRMIYYLTGLCHIRWSS